MSSIHVSKNEVNDLMMFFSTSFPDTEFVVGMSKWCRNLLFFYLKNVRDHLEGTMRDDLLPWMYVRGMIDFDKYDIDIEYPLSDSKESQTIIDFDPESKKFRLIFQDYGDGSGEVFHETVIFEIHTYAQLFEVIEVMFDNECYNSIEKSYYS